MKLSTVLLGCISSAHAFSPSFVQQRASFALSMTGETTEPTDVVAESAMPASDPYARIGIDKEELALGVDPTEFLQWIGTKDDLIGKFQRDNKRMDDERANAEVTKFMMDAEIVNAYIKFEREKVENPRDLKAEAEQNLSDPMTLATYAAWLIGGASFGYVRKNIIEPKYESGEWEQIHITLPGFTSEANAADAVASISHSMDGSVLAEALHGHADGIISSMV